MSNISKRSFLQKGTAAAAALTIVPSAVLGKTHGHIVPTDKLNIAGVDIGGMGDANLENMGTTKNIVTPCDIDWKYSRPVFDRHPQAKKHWGYCKMYDEMGKSINAMLVATADHTHAMITADAMTLGEHVYTQKPLTHSVYKSRLPTNLAKKYDVATQIGNQGSPLAEGVDLIYGWIWNGEIGEVTKVEYATNRPIWPQGLNAPGEANKTPSTLNWDLFTGPAKLRPFNKTYHPWDWRGWWDYGTGVLGDMACHILYPVFKGLNLGYPTRVQGFSTLPLQDCAPNAQYVKLVFPARDNMPKVTMPEVEVHWYDGDMTPDRPEGFPQGKELMGKGGGLCIFHGTKDTLIYGYYGVNPWLLSGRKPNVPQTLRRVKDAMEGGHEQDWIRARKESAGSRVQTKSNFLEAGPFNEMAIMGVLAVCLQRLNKELLWDGPNMRLTNIDPNEIIKIIRKDTFEVIDGDPELKTEWTDPINAQEFAAGLIKHNYREGWKLVDMPR